MKQKSALKHFSLFSVRQNASIEINKGLHRTICYLYEKLKCVCASFNSKNNGLSLLFQTVFSQWNFFLSSVALDGKDAHGLKRQLFQVFMLCIQKLLWLIVLPREIWLTSVLNNSTGAFCVSVKVLNNDFITKLI